MELLAVIVGLESLTQENLEVNVWSDSKYVVDAVEKKWIIGWQKKNFKKVKNPDLWKRFLEINKKHNVKFNWIRGHNNHPQNERCDELAVEAATGWELEIDEGYEQANESPARF
jgi:ribonuclease HI